MSAPETREPSNNLPLFKYTPNPVVIIAGTTVILAAMASMTALIYAGKDVTELRALINTILNALGAVTGIGSMLYAGAAARRSNDAANGINGQLSKNIEQTVIRAMQTTKDSPNG